MSSEREDRARRLTLDVALTLAVELVLASSLATATTRFLTRTFSRLSDYAWPIGIAMGAALLLGLMALSRLVSKHRPTYPRLKFDWHVLVKEVSYTYLSPTRMRYTRSFKLRAIRDGLDRYVDKYNWTGQGRVTLTSMEQEHTVRRTGRRNVWQIYQIEFPRTLRKREVIHTGARWDCEVVSAPPVPFFSQTISEPTKRLTFRLRLPDESGVRRVVISVLPSIDSLTPIRSEEVDVIGDEFKWEISRPKLMHLYQVSWRDPYVILPDQVVEGENNSLAHPAPED